MVEYTQPLFSSYPDGFLQYEISTGVFEYYISYQISIDNQMCTIATTIDDTVQDFDILPPFKFFTSVDKVVFLGEPEDFFSLGDRYELLTTIRNSIDIKYGLLPLVAILTEYERDRSVGLHVVKDRVYSDYIKKIETLLLEKNTPFSL